MFAVCNAIPTVVDASLALPVLDSAMVSVGLQNLEKFLFDLFLRPELEAFHPTDDVPIKLIRPQRLTVNKVWVRGPRETSRHPWVIHHFS